MSLPHVVYYFIVTYLLAFFFLCLGWFVRSPLRFLKKFLRQTLTRQSAIAAWATLTGGWCNNVRVKYWKLKTTFKLGWFNSGVCCCNIIIVSPCTYWGTTRKRVRFWSLEKTFPTNSMCVCPCKTYYASVLSMQIEGWIRLNHFFVHCCVRM